VVVVASGFEIYSHLTCPTSYRLFKRLLERGVLDRVSVRDVGLDLFGGVFRGVVSVPSIFYGGVLIYSGYFDVEEASRVVEAGDLPVLEEFDYGEASVLAMEGILDSYATALWLYLTDSIESPLSLKPFIEAVSRHIFYRKRSQESFERLVREVRELYSSEKNLYVERLREIVAKNIVREIIWLGRDPRRYREKIDLDYLEHLLLARTALGRIGLFMGYNVETHRKRVEDLYQHLKKTWDELTEKVERETKKILGDQQYIENYKSISL
jgi:predicted thioredoxin/glutaredoxin